MVQTRQTLDMAASIKGDRPPASAVRALAWSMIIAAALCPAPPLLLPGLTGAAEVLPELRRAGLAAAGELAAGDPT